MWGKRVSGSPHYPGHSPSILLHISQPLLSAAGDAATWVSPLWGTICSESVNSFFQSENFSPKTVPSWPFLLPALILIPIQEGRQDQSSHNAQLCFSRFILALSGSWGFIPPVSCISLSFHIHFSLLCTVPGWVDEIMELAVLFLDSLSPYQMGAEYPLHLTKLHSRWILLFVGALLPKTEKICVFAYWPEHLFGEKSGDEPPLPQAGLGTDEFSCPKPPGKQLHPSLGEWGRKAASPESGSGVTAPAGWCFSVICLAHPKCCELESARQTRGKELLFFFSHLVRIGNVKKSLTDSEGNAAIPT